MDNLKPQSKSANASIISATLTIFFIIFITILADLMPNLKAWLAATFTHHWIGKGVLAAVLYLVVFALLRAAMRQQPDGATAAHLKFLTWLTVLGTITIFAFFYYETYLK